MANKEVSKGHLYMGFMDLEKEDLEEGRSTTTNSNPTNPREVVTVDEEVISHVVVIVVVIVVVTVDEGVISHVVAIVVVVSLASGRNDAENLRHLRARFITLRRLCSVSRVLKKSRSSLCVP
jgi:hypothetical protein